MKLTIKFDDTDSEACRRSGILLTELGKALNPEESKPMRVFGRREPDTVDEAMALITGAGLDERAMLAAEAVLQEYRSVGENGYFLASHLARVILPFFQSPKQP